MEFGVCSRRGFEGSAKWAITFDKCYIGALGDFLHECAVSIKNEDVGDPVGSERGVLIVEEWADEALGFGSVLLEGADDDAPL